MSSKDPEPKLSPNSETLNEPESKKLPEDSTNEVTSDGEEEDSTNEVTSDEEEGECGFCLFMKAGGCKDSFVGWENCIKEAEQNNENISGKCFEATSALMKCMQVHADYYDPLLQAEKKAEEQALKEKEMEDSASHQDSRI